MIARDKNRASVVLWSVANETPLSDARLKFIGGLADKARSLDPTRLITAALETHYVNGDTIVIDDPLGKYLDVVSSNEYIGWYDGKPEKIDRIHWQLPYEKPFVISEFGADAKAGLHGDTDTRWTEEYQANVYRRQVAMFKRIPNLSGTIAWVLVDFRSPRRPLAEIQDFYNRKGLLSEQSAKKQAFYILRDYYRSLDSKPSRDDSKLSRDSNDSKPSRDSNGPKLSRDREGAVSSTWKLVWQDEFDGPQLDSTKWTYVTGGNGWGNQELEYYTNRPDNVFLENGELVIKALKEHHENRDYTSGRIVTLGKFSQTYGRFEARMKTPGGQGIWPAFWMLGDDIRTNHWPDCGEIDIMENIGREPAIVHGTIHGPGYSGGKAITSSYSLPANLSADYHVYAVEWEPSAIRWYIDDKLYKTMTPADLPSGAKWVFDHPFHLLVNLAIGGSWPGNPDASTNFPALLHVDYVRVYSRQ